MRIPIHAEHPEPRKIRHAVEALRRGGVVAYPTDTVYALGCDIFQKKALDRIYLMKQMKKDHPVAFVCADLSDIARYAVVEDPAYRMMRRLTPGPYTFILRASRDVPRVLRMKRTQVGIRVPDHPVPQALVRELGNPVVSTSASWQGEQLADPDEIDARFGGLDRVLDAGYGGLVPSTVIDLTGPQPLVLREGAGPVEGV